MAALRILACLTLLAAGAAAAAGSAATKQNHPAELVFASVRDHDALELFSMREDGTRLRRLTRQRPEPADPDWSPDGSKIAFEAVLPHADGATAIWVVDAGGGPNARRLVARGRDPAWSPDGRLVAFGAGRSLKVVSLDGRVRTIATLGDSLAAWPTWSPDGKRLLFERTKSEQAPGLGEIFSVRADGTGLAHFVHGGEPAWSPDGRRVAFSRPGSEGRSYGQIWLVNADGRDARPLQTRSHPFGLHAPSWSPDGTRLAAVRPTCCGAYTIDASRPDEEMRVGDKVQDVDWLQDGRLGVVSLSQSVIETMRADGSGRSVAYRGGLHDSAPAWSPDARTLAFARKGWRYFSDPPQVLALDDGGARVLRPLAKNPTWSPDGERLAMEDHVDVGCLFMVGYPCRRLAVLDRSGRELGVNGFASYTPAWSPSGAHLVVKARDGGLVLLDPRPGSVVRRLTPVGRADSDPDWSPDGGRVVFARTTCRSRVGNEFRGCSTSLFLVPASGGVPRLLCRDGTNPAWSPDGERIAFVRTRAGNTDIYVVGVDGRGLRRVTANPGADIDPDWRPAAA